MSQFHALYVTPAWRALRASQLRVEPLCRPCRKAGRVTAADTVDHVTPHKGDLELFHDPANLQSCCRTCHSGDKQRQEKSGTTGYRGSDTKGAPLDPSHPWNAAVSASGQGGRGCVISGGQPPIDRSPTFLRFVARIAGADA